MNKSFSIQFVSKITKLNSHTIRAWEKRYKAIVPHRDENGRRVYSQTNIDKLIKLHALVSLGNAISDIAKLDDKSLDEMYHNYAHQLDSAIPAVMAEEPTTSIKTPISIDYNLLLQNLTLALSHFKLDIISHELDKVKKSISTRDFALNVLQPILGEVGSQVDSGILSIGQEHALSAILKFHIGQMIYKVIDVPPKSKNTLIIATPEGELHEFGIMIAALLCIHYGIKFYYLGPNLPASALADTIKQIKPEIVILGVSRNYANQSTIGIENYLDQLTSLMPSKTKVWVGGVKIDSKKRPALVETISTLQLLDNQLAKL
jgi:methanogenic corrinoid protein MtbC1